MRFPRRHQRTIGRAADTGESSAPLQFLRTCGATLIFYNDRLAFPGDKTRVALKPEHVVRIRMGLAPPGWWNGGRVYVGWRDREHGREEVFNLCPQEPASIAGFKSQPGALRAALENWHQSLASYPSAQTALETLESPTLGDVTGQSPKALLPASKSFAIAFLILLVGYGITTLLSIPFGYVFTVILLLRIYEQIPHWRYREPIALAPPQVAASRAQASGAR